MTDNEIAVYGMVFSSLITKYSKNCLTFYYIDILFKMKPTVPQG